MASEAAPNGYMKFQALMFALEAAIVEIEKAENANQEKAADGSQVVDPMDRSSNSCDDSYMERNEKHLLKVPGPQDDNMLPCEEGTLSEEEENSVPCTMCDGIFGNLESLERHVTRAHKSKYKGARCDECRGTFKSRKYLRVHKDRVHSGKIIAFCDLCPATFSTKRSLTLHKNGQHCNDLKVNGGLKKKRKQTKNIVHYRCTHCKYTSSRECIVMRHFKALHVKKSETPSEFTCFYGCGQTLKSSVARDKHHRSCSRKPRPR